MTQRLRIPSVLAVAILGGASAATLMSAAGCGSDKPKQDASPQCELFCIPDGTDAAPPSSCDSCADAGNCPVGCRPVA